MAHNGKRTHEWSVESICVYYSKDPGHFYVFKVEKWLEKNEKMNAIIGMQALVPVAPGEKHGESGWHPKLFFSLIEIKVYHVNF